MHRTLWTPAEPFKPGSPTGWFIASQMNLRLLAKATSRTFLLLYTQVLVPLPRSFSFYSASCGVTIMTGVELVRACARRFCWVAVSTLEALAHSPVAATMWSLGTVMLSV